MWYTNTPMNERLRYLFDLNGYVVIRGVLSPDEAAEIKGLLEANVDGGDVPDCLVPMPDGSTRIIDYLHWGQKLRDLVDHPVVMDVMRELMGEGFRIDHYYGMKHPRGTGMLALHGGGDQMTSSFYEFRQGRMHTGFAVASWALTDTPEDGGGFACVPGSHKQNFPLPNFMESFKAGELVSMEEDPDFIRSVSVKAGDLIIFTEALAHAATAWTADSPRWAVLYKYCTAWAVWQQWEPVPEHIDALLTDEQRRLFQAPHEGLPPRLAMKQYAQAAG
jgi:hypothetical protein